MMMMMIGKLIRQKKINSWKFDRRKTLMWISNIRGQLFNIGKTQTEKRKEENSTLFYICSDPHLLNVSSEGGLKK